MRYGYVVVLYPTRTGGLFVPVGVGGGDRTGFIQIFVHRDRIEHRITLVIITPVIVIPQRIAVRVHAVVHICLPHHLAELLRVQHFHLVHVVLRRYRGVERHIQFALRTFFRSDDDHTVCCARSVDGCRSGILEDLNGLDVVRVQFVHA